MSFVVTFTLVYKRRFRNVSQQFDANVFICFGPKWAIKCVPWFTWKSWGSHDGTQTRLHMTAMQQPL